MSCIENKLLLKTLYKAHRANRKSVEVNVGQYAKFTSNYKILKKVVSLHLLIFWDGRRWTQHFCLKSQEYCSILVYNSFQNNVNMSHIYCILKGIKKKCSVKRLFRLKQKCFREDHHSKVVLWLIFDESPMRWLFLCSLFSTMIFYT